jgi:uncharacterized iron-regulated membrane protein
VRRFLLLFHRWAGVASALFLLIIALTGCALIWEDDIDRALNPATSFVTPQAGAELPVDTLIARAVAAKPQARATGVAIPQRQTWPYRISLTGGVTANVDPYTGRVLGFRNAQDFSFARWIHLVHTRFVAGQAGEFFVGALTVVTVFMSISGIVLWWPRRIYGVGKYSSWKRTNFDLHNALGFWASVFIFTISFTGIVIAFEPWLDPMLRNLDATKMENYEATAKSTPVPGGTRVPLEEVLRTARAALPGALATSINVPAKPTDFYRVMFKFPEDRTPAGRSRVYLDQFSGQVLGVTNTRLAPIGQHIVFIKRSLHTGDIYGTPTHILYFLATLALAGQVVTGVLLWWKPKKKPARAQAATSRPAA